MRKTISRVKAIAMIAKVQLQFASEAYIGELIDDYGEGAVVAGHDLVNALNAKYTGVQNGYLSDVYELITGEQVEVVGVVAKLYPCPCCNNKTLAELHNVDEGTGYEICSFCGWEDDGTVDLDQRSSVNRATINEYRDRMQQEMNFYNQSKWARLSKNEP